MGVHDGHRSRLRQRFLERGLDSFNDVNALELLLFYAIPQKDTNVLAHRLLEHFGSLEAVLCASERELTEVEGVGPNTAALLMLVPQIMRKCKVSAASKMVYLRSTRDACKYLAPRFMNERDEVFLLLCLDSQKKVICCQELSRGVVNEVQVNVRKLVEAALRNKASSVIISHNHPDGLALPSAEDDAVTKQIRNALNLVGIELTDHIIVAGGDCVSYRDSGMFDYCRW